MLHVLKSSRHFVLVFLHSFWHCDHLAWGKRELVRVLLVHLFVCFVRVSFCHFSLPLGVGVLAAVCDCGTPWTFL